MRHKKFFAVLAATAIVLAFWAMAASAIWVGDGSIDARAHTFICSGNGALEISFFDTEEIKMNFYELDGEFYVGDIGQKDDYIENGFKDAGGSLLIRESWEPVSVHYVGETFGHFEMIPQPEEGYIFKNFADSSCHCYAEFKSINGAYHANTESVLDTIEAIFIEDPNWVSTAPTLNIKLNGEPIYSDVPPFIENSRTMVPFRFIAEAFGADVVWDGNTGAVTVTAQDGTVINLMKDDINMLIVRSGEISSIPMDVAPVIRDGRTFIPVRFVAEALNVTVGWNAQTKTVALWS